MEFFGVRMAMKIISEESNLYSGIFVKEEELLMPKWKRRKL